MKAFIAGRSPQGERGLKWKSSYSLPSRPSYTTNIWEARKREEAIPTNPFLAAVLVWVAVIVATVIVNGGTP